jgi:hypothetical protein
VRELCACETFEFPAVADATPKTFDEPVALRGASSGE